MSQTTIEEIALAVKRAKDLARETMRVQYVYFDGLLLHISSKYERGLAIAARCFPGGRIELKGLIGDQVRKYQILNEKQRETKDEVYFEWTCERCGTRNTSENMRCPCEYEEV